MQKTYGYLTCIFGVCALAISLMAQGNSAATGEVAAKKVADTVIGDLCANQVSDAMKSMNQGPVQQQMTNRMLDGCGKPLECKAANNGIPVIGEDVSEESSKQTLTFTYLCKTTRQDQKYNFHIRVELGKDEKCRPQGFGCGKTTLSPPQK